jgi:hypothetical protein
MDLSSLDHIILYSLRNYGSRLIPVLARFFKRHSPARRVQVPSSRKKSASVALIFTALFLPSLGVSMINARANPLKGGFDPAFHGDKGI